MFVSTSTTLVSDDTTIPYINSMPQAANEALQILSTAGKFIIKSYEITQDGTDTGLVQKYDLETLTSDFYSLGNNKIILNDGEIYRATTNYTVEGKGIIVLDSLLVGTWTVYYNAYPQTITKDTAGSTVLALDKEVAALVPLYMASELYKDDELSTATMWRNEFEVARELLVNPNTMAIEVSSSFEGW